MRGGLHIQVLSKVKLGKRRAMVDGHLTDHRLDLDGQRLVAGRLRPSTTNSPYACWIAYATIVVGSRVNIANARGPSGGILPDTSTGPQANLGFVLPILL